MKEKPWYGMDLDGTLAYYDGWDTDSGEIGEPIKLMMDLVKKWIEDGKEVKIFTARAQDPNQVKMIKDWLEEHGLPRLDVTNKKDHNMIKIYDDRAVQVKKNRGEIVE